MTIYDYCIKTSENDLLDFSDIFGNLKPVTLEIGSGKGEFIATISRFHPERNFVGIELRDKRIISIIKKLDIKKNNNVRLLQLFVDSDLKKYIKPSTIDEMIIYHPDPWPKKRHSKNRLFQVAFIDTISYLLKPHSYLKVSTDDANYKDWIINLFKERGDFESIYPDIFKESPPEDHITTYFDILKAREGFKTYFMLYKKIHTL